MDIFTQGLVGATLAQSVSKKEHTIQATIIGFLSGILADTDVFIRSSTDPLLAIEYHRHFTHSIIFIPIGALIAFLLLRPFFRKQIENKQLYLYCFAGYLFSGFIDACTSYGTHLFWPFTDERTSWHIISIVDPLFSIILFIAIALCLFKKQKLFPRIGLLLVSVYLFIAVIQLNRAEDTVIELASERGHEIEQIMVKPTIGNVVLWRSIYLSNNHFYIDGVRVGLKTRVYEGDSIEKYERDSNLNQDSPLANDIQRFNKFSDGFVVAYPGKENVLGDVRFSMSPLGLYPLWGIEIDPNNHQKRVAYNFYRDSDEQDRKQFTNMLMNREINTE